MKESKRLPTHNDLAAEVREKSIALLNQHLADISDLYSQTKQAHWNVKGPHFYSLHLLFDAAAGAIEDSIDEIAERATALGGTALGTVRLAAQHSRLPEYPLDARDGRQHLEALVDRYSQVARSTRAAIDASGNAGDADTADLFTQLSRTLDKQLWFLESHLQA